MFDERGSRIRALRLRNSAFARERRLFRDAGHLPYEGFGALFEGNMELVVIQMRGVRRESLHRFLHKHCPGFESQLMLSQAWPDASAWTSKESPQHGGLWRS